MLRCAVVFLYACVCSTAALALPKDIHSTYRIFRNGILIGQVNEHFSHRGDSYKIVSESRSDGALNWFVRDTLTITSEGRITPAGLLPLKYEFSRASDGSKAIISTFNWEKNLLTTEHNGKQEKITLQYGTQDRLSVMYQFMFAMPRTAEVKVWMTNGRKVEQYIYRKQSDVILKTLAGDFDAVNYARDGKPEEDKAQLWLAKDKYFLPVRIIFQDRNGTQEQAIVTLSAH